MAQTEALNEREMMLPGEDAITIRKNATEVVVIEAKEFNGVALVDVRVWTADPHGTPGVATKKGLCLRPETWAEVLPAIQGCLAASAASR